MRGTWLTHCLSWARKGEAGLTPVWGFISRKGPPGLRGNSYRASAAHRQTRHTPDMWAHKYCVNSTPGMCDSCAQKCCGPPLGPCSWRKAILSSPQAASVGKNWARWNLCVWRMLSHETWRGGSWRLASGCASWALSSRWPYFPCLFFLYSMSQPRLLRSVPLKRDSCRDQVPCKILAS